MVHIWFAALLNDGESINNNNNINDIDANNNTNKDDNDKNTDNNIVKAFHFH